MTTTRRTTLAMLALGLALTTPVRGFAPWSRQAPARDAAVVPTPPAGTARIAGHVLDDEGHAIRRAAVSITGDMRLTRSTVTDDAGAFSFVNLPKGRFTINAIKAGYPQMSFGASRPYRTGSGLLVTDGQVVSDVVLTLPRGVVLTGTVFDDHGQPMPGVPVMAYQVSTSLSGERTFNNGSTVASSVTTDDHGVYRVFGLPPGEYTVGTAWFFGSRGGIRVPTDAEIQAAFQASTPPIAGRGGAPSGQPLPRPPTFNYAPVFAPNVVDPLNAATYTLSAGQVRDGVDLHMQFTSVVALDGRVVGPGGPVPIVQIVLARHTQVASMQITTFSHANPDGTFTSNNLIAASYDLVAEAPATSDHPALWAETTFTISGSESEPLRVALTLQPAMSLTGSILFDAAATLRKPDLSQIQVNLNGARGTTSTNAMPAIQVDSAGRFTITAVRPGRFRLAARVPGAAPPGQPAWSLLSVTADGRDVTDLPIDIAAGAVPSLTVTFTDRASSLSGTITTASGQPATDYFVVAFPADDAYWDAPSRRIASTRPDASGRYVFSSLPPGDYRLAVITDLVQGDLADRGALVRLRDQSAAVTIALGEQKSLDVKIGG